jgi:hypothetical protein
MFNLVENHLGYLSSQVIQVLRKCQLGRLGNFHLLTSTMLVFQLVRLFQPSPRPN